MNNAIENSKNSNARQSILIVLIAGIGDLILASKSLRSIRTGFPDAEIHLLTSNEASVLAKNYRFLNRVWTFPIREMRSSILPLFNVFKLLMNLRKIEFTSIINLYMVGSVWGALKMGLMFLLLKGINKIGHGTKVFSIFLTQKVPSDTFNNKHLADAMMTIAIAAGGVPDNNDIMIYWDKNVEEEWRDFFSRKIPSQTIIGINPGGDRKNRRWDPNHYSEVADKLIEKFNASIVLLGGPGEENIASIVESRMKNKPVNLAGKLSLNELAYIISRMNLLITNDSGPMHIGAATKTPLVAIFGPEIPLLTGPYTSTDLYRVIDKQIHCRPCKKDECNKPICLDLISPEEVFIKCVELITYTKRKDLNT